MGTPGRRRIRTTRGGGGEKTEWEEGGWDYGREGERKEDSDHGGRRTRTGTMGRGGGGPWEKEKDRATEGVEGKKG